MAKKSRVPASRRSRARRTRNEEDRSAGGPDVGRTMARKRVNELGDTGPARQSGACACRGGERGHHGAQAGGGGPVARRDPGGQRVRGRRFAPPTGRHRC